MIVASDFDVLLDAVREFSKVVDDLSEVLGVVPTKLYTVSTAALEYVEKQSGVIWTDDIWEAVYCSEKDAEEIIAMINALVEKAE